MFGLNLGKLGSVGRALAAWTPAQLWPLGASSPGLWIDPPYTASMFQDSAGTTAISAIGTVLDTSNPVGLVLDRKGGATSPAGPGIHLSQATATSRPVASARVNRYVSTEDFTSASWIKANGASAPSANTLNFVETGYVTQFFGSGYGGLPFTVSMELSGSGTIVLGKFDNVDGFAFSSQITLTSTPTRYSFSTTVGAGASDFRPLIGSFDSTATVVTANKAQFNLGSTDLPYQRVTTASDYDASAGPTYTKLDGADDGWSSATFAAGTLTSSMDCLIAVRRDSTANMICGLIGQNSTYYFGAASVGSSGVSYSNAGPHTVWVDGVQLAGGTAVTEGAIAAALSAGAWHILEFRGLDLALWTFAILSDYPSWQLNGGVGEIQLFASGQPINRDLARQELAAYFGVTLP